jgi:glycolate oxidase FAD binding subunit
MKFLQRLENEFGAAVAARAAGAEDAVDEVAPQVVAAPRDEDAAQKLVAWCGRGNVAFVTRGGGTKLGIGAPPQRCDLLLSTEHLDDVVEHDVGNATVSAGAGIALAKLNEVVRENGQFVPLDDAFGENASGDNAFGGAGVLHRSATLGGAVATNTFGASRLKYGAPRDLVVGLHAALSDGRSVRAGSKVVKNVSGYDLNKLFIGSFGTLGLITRVTIRLRPQDVAGESWQSTLSGWDEAREAAAFVLNGAFEPTALSVAAHEGAFYLRARFDGGTAAVAAQIERLGAKLARAEAETEQPAGEGALALRAHLPLQSAAGWAESAQQAGANRVVWECGLGLVRAGFFAAPDDAATVSTLRAAAQAGGGFLVVEKAPAALKSPDWVWGEPRPDFALMQRLKNAFDKHNVCAPGRFAGGL